MTSKVFDELIEIILDNIGFIQYFDDDMDDKQWGASTSASCCLRLIAHLLKGDVLDKVTSYAGAKINKDCSSKEKYVGLICLGAIIEGPKEMDITNTFSNAIDLLLDLLTDSNAKVRETACWVLTLLCTNAPQVLNDSQIFDCLKGKFNDLLNNDQVCGAKIANAIGELCKSLFTSVDQNNNLFSNHFEDIFKLMLDFSNFAFKDIQPSSNTKGT